MEKPIREPSDERENDKCQSAHTTAICLHLRVLERQVYHLNWQHRQRLSARLSAIAGAADRPPFAAFGNQLPSVVAERRFGTRYTIKLALDSAYKTSV
jgi:hypothetical protein